MAFLMNLPEIFKTTPFKLFIYLTLVSKPNKLHIESQFQSICKLFGVMGWLTKFLSRENKSLQSNKGRVETIIAEKLYQGYQKCVMIDPT